MALIYVQKSLMPERLATPWGKDHTHQCECVSPTVWLWGVTHCGVAAECYLRWRAGVQDLMPGVGHLKLAQVPTEGWIIDLYEHGLLDGPGNAMQFPTFYGKTVHIDAVS